MKKDTLILLGLGAVALYFVMQRRRRGSVEVFSPEVMTEEEFGTPSTDQRQPEDIIERGRNIFDTVKTVFQRSPEKKQARQERRAQRKTTRQAQRKVRQEKRATSRIKRQERRKVRRQKVGEISIMY